MLTEYFTAYLELLADLTATGLPLTSLTEFIKMGWSGQTMESLMDVVPGTPSILNSASAPTHVANTSSPSLLSSTSSASPEITASSGLVAKFIQQLGTEGSMNSHAAMAASRKRQRVVTQRKILMGASHPKSSQIEQPAAKMDLVEPGKHCNKLVLTVAHMLHVFNATFIYFQVVQPAAHRVLAKPGKHKTLE